MAEDVEEGILARFAFLFSLVCLLRVHGQLCRRRHGGGAGGGAAGGTGWGRQILWGAAEAQSGNVTGGVISHSMTNSEESPGNVVGGT